MSKHSKADVELILFGLFLATWALIIAALFL